MGIEIEWTNDCQGKKSYDAGIVTLSSRYWPSGGGFGILSDGVIQCNDARPEIKPRAKSSIYFGTEVLAEQRFDGETEEEVKEKVEIWASAQVAKLEIAVRRTYMSQSSQHVQKPMADGNYKGDDMPDFDSDLPTFETQL